MLAIRGDEMERGDLQLSQLHGHLEAALCDTALNRADRIVCRVCGCWQDQTADSREVLRERVIPLPREWGGGSIS